MTHVYMASRSALPGMAVLDLYVLCMYVGFMAEMVDSWCEFDRLLESLQNALL